MERPYNFSAGPATLPDEVLRQAQEELCDWHGTGMSVMEMSHRGSAFLDILAQAKHNCRSLMQVPDHYRILFLQGGARLQFAMVPLNLGAPNKIADYVNTGHWSTLATEEAAKYITVKPIVSQGNHNATPIPQESTWHRHTNACYLHFTSNETIHGIQFPTMPSSLDDVPLVSDMSSDFMSRVIDVSQLGLIYAGAQKNVGPAGLTIVIIREDLLERPQHFNAPTMLQYRTYADTDSLYNTPPTFAIYVAGLVFEWIKKQGGIPAIAQRNQQKAALLYRTIDESGEFYSAPVQAPYRSTMNIVFRLANEALNELFLKQADQCGLKSLKGHKVLGGMRASLYNAMPLAGVEALSTFMREFARKNA